MFLDIINHAIIYNRLLALDFEQRWDISYHKLKGWIATCHFYFDVLVSCAPLVFGGISLGFTLKWRFISKEYVIETWIDTKFYQ